MGSYPVNLAGLHRFKNRSLRTGYCPRQTDQYFYPFYKKDIESGKLTKEQALELIAMLLVKVNDAVVLMSSVFAEQFTGFPTITNVTVGGVTDEGKDAVNELSYLILEAEKQVRY